MATVDFVQGRAKQVTSYGKNGIYHFLLILSLPIEQAHNCLRQTLPLFRSSLFSLLTFKGK